MDTTTDSQARTPGVLNRLRHWLHGATPPPATVAVSPAAATPEVAPPVAATTGASPLVIDVRSLREFEGTALEGAIHLPLSDLEHGIGAVAPDLATPLVLYCASGGRSGMACMVLRQLGYTNVTNAGGLYAAAAKLQRNLRP